MNNNNCNKQARSKIGKPQYPSDHSPNLLKASSELGTMTGSNEPTTGPRVGQTFYVGVRGHFLEKWTPGESASLVMEKMAEHSEQRARLYRNRGGRKQVKSGRLTQHGDI